MDNNNQKQENMDIHQLLVQTYGTENTPQDVNLRLKNRLQYEKQTSEKGISFWWLPALVNTTVVIGIASICVILYIVVNYISADWLMPNLTHIVTKLWVSTICGLAVIQIGLSWIFTLLSVWKLNLKNKCQLFHE